MNKVTLELCEERMKVIGCIRIVYLCGVALARGLLSRVGNHVTRRLPAMRCSRCVGCGSSVEYKMSSEQDAALILWGDHGQTALEQAKVCLINATATGTEILKSLVLPGIGAFTIVDGKKVTEEDIGCKYDINLEPYFEKRSVAFMRART
ncbi:unnamed protein product [Timema podura]|uniref:THIF-type NAD/FAD binding fold domain-containing protein n=1 Tax=Timema podura TaxID=61482 RepID=A0ABN7NPD6_TIMPD|nr:unnamed protein product [Timema podura]